MLVGTRDTRACTLRSSAALSLVAHVLSRLALSLVLACVLIGALPGCGGGGAEGTSDGKAEALSLPTFKKEEVSGASFKLPGEVKVPSVADSGGTTTIDTSGVTHGWVGARGHSSMRLKFQVIHGEMTYNYDLPSDGTAVCFPINMGNGDYFFRIMENVEGNSYAELSSASANITLDSEFSPFLTPNIYCNYTPESNCVKKARQLLKKADNQGEAVKQICTFVAKNVTYDYDKAEELAKGSGYIPNADATLKEKKGICFDYACLSAAMLRSAGLPAQVVTGYVSPDDLYHAWTMVYIDGTWKSALFTVTPNKWSRCDVTFASAGAGSTIGDGTQYTDRFIF